MTLQMVLALGILVLMIVMIMSDKFAFGAPPLFACLLLVLTGLSTPQEAFAGFINSSVIMVAGFMVVMAALMKTSFIARVQTTMINLVNRGGYKSYVLLLIVVMLGASLAGMGSTGYYVLILSLVSTIPYNKNMPTSKLMMPLGFATWICEDSPEGLTNDPTEFRVSDDAGESWKVVRMPDSAGRVHANLIEVEPGHLVAFMRSRFADNVYISESNDFGDSWSVPEKTVLPNNNASISAIKLQTGEIAMAYNVNATRNPEFGKVSWPGLRNPVAVSVTEDFGKTWPIGRVLEAAEGYIGAENKTNNLQYEYPTLYQTKDGLLHLVYAYKNRLCVKYVRFSVEDLFGAKREADGLYNPTSGAGVEK